MSETTEEIKRTIRERFVSVALSPESPQPFAIGLASLD